jgi:hypothetical protein
MAEKPQGECKESSCPKKRTQLQKDNECVMVRGKTEGNLQLKYSEASKNCAGITHPCSAAVYPREDRKYIKDWKAWTNNQRGCREFEVCAHRSLDERMISVGIRCKNRGRKRHTLVYALAN